MSDEQEETPTHSRREVLVGAGVGLAVLAAEGCAMFRGGAVHPKLDVPQGAFDGRLLKLPVSALGDVVAGTVLLVELQKPNPKLLIGPGAQPNEFRVVSAECTHWGCILEWDAAKTEWLCPCHGSKFATDGAVLHGPARKPLPIPVARVADGVLEIDVGALTAAKT